jgi:hypothetical protein
MRVSRIIALLALIFGFVSQGLLDGQTFSHAVFGIICGVVVVVFGLAASSQDPAHRWTGRIMAVLGFTLGVWCLVLLPSAYRFQQHFNHRREERQQTKESASSQISEERMDRESPSTVHSGLGQTRP